MERERVICGLYLMSCIILIPINVHMTIKLKKTMDHSFVPLKSKRESEINGDSTLRKEW